MWRDLLRMWKSSDLLSEAWNESYEMLQIDQEMFLEGVRVLRQSNDAVADQRILDQDKIVDGYEQEVRRKVMTHCSVQGPAEMPQSMVLVTIVIDIERIGDYIKNMVYLAVNHPARLEGGIFESDLRRIEEAVKGNFVRTRECIESSDQSRATEVLDETKWISQVCDSSLIGLVQEKDASITPGQAAALALYFRLLKRIDSHLGDIATSVVNPFDRIGFKPKQ